MATYTIKGKEDTDPSNQPIRATLTVEVDDDWAKRNMTPDLWRDLWQEIGLHFLNECLAIQAKPQGQGASHV